MHFLLCLLLSTFLATGAGAQKIYQWPATKLQVAESQLFLDCSTKGTSEPNLYWYHQPLGGSLQLLSFSITKGQVEDQMPQRFQGSRPDKDHFQLRSNKILVTDSGFYYCAWSLRHYNERQYFGSGTKLVVVDDLTKVTPPKVTVFQPSEEEIEKKGKATLVCLATGFYPDLVQLTWWVNGEETKIGVSTDPKPSKEQPQDSFSYYTLSSRLRVSAPFWRNPKNNFRCQVLFHGISENETWTNNESKPITQNVSDQLWGRADCGITSESYQRSIQSATFFYVILLGKAMLYGLLVSVLVWRTMAKEKHS